MGRPKTMTQQDKTDYKRQFNAETYDRLYPYVSKGKKDTYRAAAEKLGMSLNEFIEHTLDKEAWKVLHPKEAAEDAKEAEERAKAEAQSKLDYTAQNRACRPF